VAVFLACSQDVGCGHRQRHSEKGEAINVFLQLPKEAAQDQGDQGGNEGVDRDRDKDITSLDGQHVVCARALQSIFARLRLSCTEKIYINCTLYTILSVKTNSNEDNS